MRLFFRLVIVFALFVLAGCVEQQSGGQHGLAHPNVVIVREFAFSPGAVTLDPSFGFSLNRGAPGVPPRQRAAAIGRAAAFEVASTVADRLRELGFDAIRSDTDQPEPGARALVVTGAFRQINEGYRRRVGAENAHIVAEAQVQYVGPGSAPSVLMAKQLDTQALAGDVTVANIAARRGAGDINANARKIGLAIARDIAEVARRNNWPIAGR